MPRGLYLAIVAFFHAGSFVFVVDLHELTDALQHGSDALIGCCGVGGYALVFLLFYFSFGVGILLAGDESVVELCAELLLRVFIGGYLAKKIRDTVGHVAAGASVGGLVASALEDFLRGAVAQAAFVVVFSAEGFEDFCKLFFHLELLLELAVGFLEGLCLGRGEELEFVLVLLLGRFLAKLFAVFL